LANAQAATILRVDCRVATKWRIIAARANDTCEVLLHLWK